MSKYIDLGPRVAEDTRKSLTSACHMVQLEALRWLDEHPDQTPGRTITEADYRQAMLDATEAEDFDTERFLQTLGITVVPDPEPTEESKIEKIILDHAVDTDPRRIAEILVQHGVTVGDES